MSQCPQLSIPHFRNVQRVVKNVEKRDDGFGTDRPCSPPFALPEFFAR